MSTWAGDLLEPTGRDLGGFGAGLLTRVTHGRIVRHDGVATTGNAAPSQRRSIHVYITPIRAVVDRLDDQPPAQQLFRLPPAGAATAAPPARTRYAQQTHNQQQ